MNRALSLLLACATAFSCPAATTERPDAKLRALLIEAIASGDTFADRYDAEVWLVDMSGRLTATLVDPAERIEILRVAHREASRAGLSPQLVLSVIEVESNFDRFAISTVGALGLMQVMPFWLDEIGRHGDNLLQIETNLRIGCTILRYYIDAEHGHLARALARYNGSTGRTWYPTRVFKAWRARWEVR